MRRDWIVFSGIILALGYPVFALVRLFEHILPYQILGFIILHPYIQWALVTLPTGIASFYVWSLYVLYRYGLGGLRLIIGVASLLPILLSADKKMATFFKVAPGVIDFFVYAGAFAITLFAVSGLFSRFGLGFRSRT